MAIESSIDGSIRHHRHLEDDPHRRLHSRVRHIDDLHRADSPARKGFAFEGWAVSKEQAMTKSQSSGPSWPVKRVGSPCGNHAATMPPQGKILIAFSAHSIGLDPLGA